MTGYITMFDALDLSQIPAGAAAVAGYVNGRWPTFARLRGQFPGASLLSIAVTAGADAECLDIETGDATPADAAAWYGRQKARGVSRPCLYASASVMEAVVAVMNAAGVDRGSVRLWAAHYTGSPHICGPSSCRLMSVEADACQWSNRALGRDLDESLLLADFFGTAAPVMPVPPATASVRQWTTAGIDSLAELAAAQAQAQGSDLSPAEILRLTARYGPANGYSPEIASWLNGVFSGQIPAAHPMPAGLVLYLPG